MTQSLPRVTVELVHSLVTGAQTVEVRYEGCDAGGWPAGGWPMVVQLLMKALEAALPQAFAQIYAQASGKEDARIVLASDIPVERH